MREALGKNWTQASQATEWEQHVPKERIEKWFQKLYRAPEFALPGGRLVNRFALGADPEFVLIDPVTHGRFDARGLDLKAGPAAGADNNGRLVELRPAPSRCALEVLASVWVTMRWLGMQHPASLKYAWRAGAYFQNDGLGGHIHFGRKRTKLRDKEVSNLDRITHLLYTAGCFDREEGRMRVRQSQGAPTGHYGGLSDIRSQTHGYEFRTLPSWLDNPWLGYLVIVLSKLVVAQADAVPGLVQADGGLSPEQARQQIRFLLAYYAPLDDDARLAFTILQTVGFPREQRGDFKSAWGIYYDATAPSGGTGLVWPSLIPARPADAAELAQAMYEARSPDPLPLEPTWSPARLPKGYIPCIDLVNTHLQPGVGEFCIDLCFSTELQPQMTNNNDSHQPLQLDMNSFKAIAELGYGAKFPDITVGMVGTSKPALWFGRLKDYDFKRVLEARDFIVEAGVLPIWPIKSVKPESFQEWANRTPPASRVSKQVYDSRKPGGF